MNSRIDSLNIPKYKSLEHVSTVVVATNEHELAYIRSWCKQAGKGDPYRGDVESFPFCVSTAGELAGWTDRTDRALYYKPFSEFLFDIGNLCTDENDVELWECTKCGRRGSVGRCCGIDTRAPVRYK